MNKIVRIALPAIMSVALVGLAQAQPAGKGPRIGKPGTVKQVESLKPGDQYAVVCTMCKTVEVKTVAEGESTAALTKEGASMMCGGCKNEATVKRIGPPSKKHLTYVNKNGQECMFVALLKKR